MKALRTLRILTAIGLLFIFASTSFAGPEQNVNYTHIVLFVPVGLTSYSATVESPCGNLAGMLRDYPRTLERYAVEVRVFTISGRQCEIEDDLEIVVTALSSQTASNEKRLFKPDSAAGVNPLILKTINGAAVLNVDFGELPDRIVLDASLKSGVHAPARLTLNSVDLSTWRYRLEWGAEFNQDVDSGFGKIFHNLGLTTNSHWGHSFHTEFEARLTSVLSRDIVKEAETAKSSSSGTPDPNAELLTFFNSQKAFATSLTIFYDPWSLFAAGRRASDRTRFGPIVKYMFRTAIDRKTQQDKAEVQKLVQAETDQARKQALLARLSALEEVAPPSKDVISEAFAGLRLAHYPKHYEDSGECLPPGFGDIDMSLDDVSRPACPDGFKRFRRTLERNAPAVAYFHLMWGGSEHLQNENRDAKPVFNNPRVFDIVRSGFKGRILLEGYMKAPRAPIGLRFISNLGPGEDEIRFTVFSNFDLNRLSSLFK